MCVCSFFPLRFAFQKMHCLLPLVPKGITGNMSLCFQGTQASGGFEACVCVCESFASSYFPLVKGITDMLESFSILVPRCPTKCGIPENGSGTLDQ